MDDKSEIIAELYADPIKGLRVLLPHWFPRKMPWVHRGIVAILFRRTDFLLNFGPEAWRDEDAEWTLEDLLKIQKHFLWEKPDGTTEPIFEIEWQGDEPVAVHMTLGRFTCIMMPRGFSKTTLVNGCDILKILFKDIKFLLKVSETGGHSEKQLGNLKREFETNERIIELFGRLQPDYQSSLKWTADEIHTTNGCFVVAKGRGGQVRGLNIDAIRPDSIDVDDLEDPESVSTPEQRDKVLNWFVADLKPVLPKLNPDATMTVLGTLLHREALLMRIARDPEWTFIRFGAKVGDDWLWPEMMNETGWESEKASFALQGKLSKFYMEYGSEWRDDDSAKFKTEFFVGIIQPRSRAELVARAIVIDPAISQRIGADRTAIAVAGMTEKGIIHLCDSWGQVGADPRLQIDKYFEMRTAWDCTRHGVEAISYQAALVHLLREEMFRRHQYFEIVPITHSTKKSERIEGVLQPRYASRYITHQREFPVLMQMLLDWPNGGFDDVDAFAMAVTLLDPYAAFAADPSKDPCDDEFEPLEKVIGGRFGSAP